MKEKKKKIASLADLIAEYRGIYSRVSRRFKVDPSYVSRIARRQRDHKPIEAALAKEVSRLSRLGLKLTAHR
jgi:hypothetical protein